MRTIGLVALMVAGCGDGCGPPRVALGGVCDGTVQRATAVAVPLLILTDIDELASASDLQVTDPSGQPSDYLTATSDGSMITLVGERDGSGYLDVVAGSNDSIRWRARFAIAVAEWDYAVVERTTPTSYAPYSTVPCYSFAERVVER